MARAVFVSLLCLFPAAAAQEQTPVAFEARNDIIPGFAGSSSTAGLSVANLLSNDVVYVPDMINPASFEIIDAIGSVNVTKTVVSGSLTRFEWDDGEFPGGQRLDLVTKGPQLGRCDVYGLTKSQVIQYSVCLTKNADICDTAFASLIDDRSSRGTQVTFPYGPLVSNTGSRENDDHSEYYLKAGDSVPRTDDVRLTMFGDVFRGGPACIDFIYFCFDGGFPVEEGALTCRNERRDPYDVGGGNETYARPMDMAQFLPGYHELSYVVQFSADDDCGGFSARGLVPFYLTDPVEAM